MRGGTSRGQLDELACLDELMLELRKDARSPNPALGVADRKRPGDTLDERIARWECGRSFSRVEVLLHQLEAQRVMAGGAP